MKSKRIYLTTLTLAVLAALLMQSSAPAEQSKPLPSTGQGRQIIAGKLDSIRLERILYDGLPLGEVVKNLMDEAKKRDPEKKGINFVLTSNDNANAPSRTDPLTGIVEEVVDI